MQWEGHGICSNLTLRVYLYIEYYYDIPVRVSLIDPSDAIADYIMLNEKHYDYFVKERKQEENVIRDIYDEDLYRTFVNLIPENEKYQYVSLTINSDGTQAFES